MKFLVLISIILSIKSTFGLNCYSCNSGTYPNCGDNMTNTTKIPIATCKTPNDFCVTFYNSFDNNNIYRGCSGSFIVPEGLDKIDTCVLDQYTKSVFCSCKTDYCNKGQMGNLEITKIDECLSSPCLNGATCVDLYNNYTCQCAQNFTGSTCEKCIPGNIGPDCSEVFDPCKNQPCQHGGTCQDDTKGSYICSCTTGWTDNECTTRINPCANYPCENGGECTDLEILDQFNCTCDGTGYQGNTCSQDIDECALSIDKCDNGTCSNTDGSYKCVCNPGFTGKLCDIDINECMPNPCKNGTCSNELNSYSCSCFPGFTGKNCELDINECTTQTCSGNGKCENLIASYRCNCNPGFTGKECETNIDECVSNPCLNSGICNDTVNGFICECVTGYNGTRCEYEINECSSNPCQNSGTCRNRIGSYSCACAPGFTGKNCETDIDECLPEPCNPAGSLNCTDKINGFECICDKGFFGPTCDDLVPPTPCNSNPCKNGGTCSNTIDGSKYICSCTNGFDGDDCSLIVQNFCIGVTCVNGNPVSNPDAKNCTCDCKPGFSGLMCEKENAQCTKVGTFPDPVYCWNYYTCTQGANGLIKDVFSCPIKQLSTGPLQLLFQFDPATQTGLCKFPSTFTSYSGITCSKN